MPLKIMQTNVNHARQAQDLLVQNMREYDIALALIAEPYNIPNHPNWVGDTDRKAAITWQSSLYQGACVLRARGRGYVAVEMANIVIFSCYVTPKCTRDTFESYLDAIGDTIAECRPRSILIAGDFNAKCVQWGSIHTNMRGRILNDWVAEQDLRIINSGTESTCIRWQGESIIDVTMGSPDILQRITDWHVAVDMESLSDHQNILMCLQMNNQEDPTRRCRNTPQLPKWQIRKMDKDMLQAATLATVWPGMPEWLQAADDIADWIGMKMHHICNVAMPKAGSGGRNRNRSVHWWSAELDALRRKSIAMSRAYTRARRRGDPTLIVQRKYNSRRDARQAFKNAIRNAKAQAWQVLINKLNSDPWGKPYLIVMLRLRMAETPIYICESLDPEILERILDGLFPHDTTPFRWDVPGNQTDHTLNIPELTIREVELVAKRLKGPIKAPGPDGIPGRAWAHAMPYMIQMIRRLYQTCFDTTTFPVKWKRTKLVLIKKPGRPDHEPSSYRPICLVDDISKLFEKIIAERIIMHLEDTGPNLADAQFGFRKRRSTIDAVLKLRSLTQEVITNGGIAVAVSLDITNAFNTLPYWAIAEALKYHGVPQYLVQLIESYLRNRHLCYIDQQGNLCNRGVSCGVPQGSVLGPLLWDLAYDKILRTPMMPLNCSVLCYADDTLIVAGGRNFPEAVASAEAATASIIRAIKRLGLQIAPQKTEAIAFGPKTWKYPLVYDRIVKVANADIPITESIKYLGLTIDAKWEFTPHFRSLAPRVDRVMTNLGRLMPNLRGPTENIRHLYIAVLDSVFTYGAPVWADSFRKYAKRYGNPLQKIRKQAAIRVICGYRTISYVAATLLARTPPWELLCDARRKTYHTLHSARRDGIILTEKAIDTIKARADTEMLLEWQTWLDDDRHPGQKTITAILPVFDAWIGRPHGHLTFWMTQILTGHGVFGRYLHQIGKVLTPICEHCGKEEDTVFHTVQYCPAWTEQRQVLRDKIGLDLSLAAIVHAIVTSDENWKVFASFCETIMSTKAAAERARQQQERL